MKKIFPQIIWFWFVLLALAIFNAAIREIGYKPLLEPLIGAWAHQLSSLTGIILFFSATYFFLQRRDQDYSRKELLMIGSVWTMMTLAFEVFMNIYLRQLTWQQVLETYYFWQGETWPLVLLALLFSPLLAQGLRRRRSSASLAKK